MNHWLTKIQNLKPGDACEVEHLVAPGWQPAVIIRNGAAGYWTVRLTLSGLEWQGYIEQVRLPGQKEAWPR